MKYPLASSTWDEKEIEAIHGVIAKDMYTMGEGVKQFETEYSIVNNKYLLIDNFSRRFMKILSSIHIGPRLTMGFAIVILLSLVSTAFSLVAAKRNAEATRQMMAQPLAKERLVSDCYLLIAAAIARTALIAKSTDQVTDR